MSDFTPLIETHPQGVGGVYHGYLNKPLENIIRFISLYGIEVCNQTIEKLIDLIIKIISSRHSSIREKISSIRLLILLNNASKLEELKSQKGDLWNFFVINKESRNIGFGDGYGELSLKISEIIMKIAFNCSSNNEFFEKIVLLDDTEQKAINISQTLINDMFYKKDVSNIGELESIFNFIIKYSKSRYEETRIVVIYNLFELLNTQYQDIVLLTLNKMFDNEYYSIKIAILERLKYIIEIDSEFYSKILDKAVSDNNYLVRKFAQEIQGK